MAIKWSFPLNGYGQICGLQNPSEEFFKNDPYGSLAREICQNSIDASNSKTKPVRVEFETFEINSVDFPGRNDYLEAMQNALYTWENKWNEINNKDTTDFFKETLKILSKDKIQFLRISDYKTTGLLGSNQTANSNWTSLLKSVGVSDKSEIAGGSKGIGKGAAFVVSRLKTIFYATKDIYGLEAMQGVASLASFLHNGNEEPTQGVGYYGNEIKNSPIEEWKSLQKSFVRTEPGTDIFIAGFNISENWRIEVINAVLINFLYAIYKGTLEVVVENEMISKYTLSMILNKYHNNIDKEIFQYYDVLTSKQSIIYEEDFENMGNIKLYLKKIAENPIRKVLTIRKPWMTIKEFDRINTVYDYAGILIVEGDELNKFLRKLESPEHKDWSYERARTIEEKKNARNVLKNLKTFIKNKIKELFINDIAEELDVPNLGNLLPLNVDETNESKKITDDILSPRPVEVKVKKQKVRKLNKIDEEDGLITYLENNEGIVDEEGELEALSKGDISGGDYKKVDPIYTNILDGVDVSLSRVVEIVPKFNHLIVLDKAKGYYRIVFKPKMNLNQCYLEIKQLDEQGYKYPLKVIGAKKDNKDLDILNRRIQYFSIEENKHEIIDIIVDKKSYFTAEVKIYGIEK